MIDLKEIEKDIETLKNALSKRRDDYSKTKESNLKEQYGDDFGCDNCAYSCCVDIGDYHTSCTKNHCIYCRNYCDEYVPSNELSEYIRNNDVHHYNESLLDTLDDLFYVSDIMQHPELYRTAIDILKLRDKKENNQ